MFGIGKKPIQEEPLAATPTQEVLRMREQGLSNNQIVQALQRNGYKTHQIFDAMNQADLKTAGPVEGAIEPELAQQPEELQPEIGEQMQPQYESEPAAQPPSQSSGAEDQIEDLAEAIIEEKWEDLMKEINKLLEWKEAMENKMSALEQNMKNLQSSSDNLQKAVLGKVTEYDKTMRSVGANMSAMDSVFKKVLPTLTDNVNELSRITKKARAKK